jgi:hypothetical protein
MRARMPPRARWIALCLALVAGSAFALAVQSPWWSAGEVAIGTFGSRHCFAGECRTSGLAWIGASELWLRAGIAMRAAGFIAMFALLVLAAGLAARRAPRLVAGAVLTSIVTAMVAGGYFAVAFPGLGGASFARGLVMFGVAIVTGIVAAIIVLRAPPRA